MRSVGSGIIKQPWQRLAHVGCQRETEEEKRDSARRLPEQHGRDHRRRESPLGFGIVVRDGGLLFNLHVAELVGVEHFSAFQAFDILHVFLAGDDSDSWVFAGDRHFFGLRTVNFE